MADNSFVANYAPTGRATCKYKNCEEKKIDRDQLRVGKTHPSPFHDGTQTDYYHALCIFKSFANVRKDTKVIDDVEIIEGFGELKPADQDVLRKLVKEFSSGDLKERTKEELKEQRLKRKQTEADLSGEEKTPKKAKIEKKEKKEEKAEPEEDVMVEEVKPAKKEVMVDKLKLRGALSDAWLSLLAAPLGSVSGMESILGGSADEKKSRLKCFENIEPEEVRAVLIFRDENDIGFPLLSQAAESLNSPKAKPLVNFLAQLRKIHPEGSLDGYASLWLQHIISQGILFVPLRGKSDAQKSAYTEMAAIVIQALIDFIKTSSKNHGFAVMMMGNEGKKLESRISDLKYSNMDDLTMVVRALPHPSDDEFITRTKNPIGEIDAAILEANHQPITWTFGGGDGAVQAKEEAAVPFVIGEAQLVGCEEQTQGMSLKLDTSSPTEVGRNSFDGLKQVKSVSRRQVLVSVVAEAGKTGVKIELVGSNPLIYSKDDSNEPLTQPGESVVLFHGDKFFLVADSYQFEVKVTENANSAALKAAKEKERKEKEKEKEREKEMEKQRERERAEKDRKAREEKEKLQRAQEEQREKDRQKKLEREKEAERERARQNEMEKAKAKEKGAEKESYDDAEENPKPVAKKPSVDLVSEDSAEIPKVSKKRVLPWGKGGGGAEKKSPAKKPRTPKKREDDFIDSDGDDDEPKSKKPRRAAPKKPIKDYSDGEDKMDVDEEKEKKPAKKEEKEEKKEEKADPGFVNWDEVGDNIGKPKKRAPKKKGEDADDEFHSNGSGSEEDNDWMKDAAADDEESEVVADDEKPAKKEERKEVKDDQKGDSAEGKVAKKPVRKPTKAKKKYSDESDDDEDEEDLSFVVADDDEDALKPVTTSRTRANPPIASQPSSVGGGGGKDI